MKFRCFAGGVVDFPGFVPWPRPAPIFAKGPGGQGKDQDGEAAAAQEIDSSLWLFHVAQPRRSAHQDADHLLPDSLLNAPTVLTWRSEAVLFNPHEATLRPPHSALQR